MSMPVYEGHYIDSINGPLDIPHLEYMDTSSAYKFFYLSEDISTECRGVTVDSSLRDGSTPFYLFSIKDVQIWATWTAPPNVDDGSLYMTLDIFYSTDGGNTLTNLYTYTDRPFYNFNTATQYNRTGSILNSIDSGVLPFVCESWNGHTISGFQKIFLSFGFGCFARATDWGGNYIQSYTAAPLTRAIGNSYLVGGYNLETWANQVLTLQYNRTYTTDIFGVIDLGNMLVSRGVLSSNPDIFTEWWESIYKVTTDLDPNISGEVAGNGTYDTTSDQIGVPPLPTLTAGNSGMINVYLPTQTILQNFKQWLYGSSIQTILLSAIARPLDYIVSLTLLPFQPSSDGSSSIQLTWLDSGVSCPFTTNTARYLYAGSYELSGFYGGAIDYSTRVGLYIPFVGVVDIDPQWVINSTLSLSYNVDIISGDCIAHVNLDKTFPYNVNSVIYHFRGNMGQQVPIIGRDLSQIIKPIAGAASSFATGNLLGGAVNAADALHGVGATKMCGDLTSNSVFLDNWEPYLILYIPQESRPDKYAERMGMPSNVYYSELSSLFGTGFLQMEPDSIKIESQKATDKEREMLKTALERGVIFR